MTLFGIAALLAPVVGPTLGGYITDNYGWRWIFYLNVPVGLFALLHVQRRWSRTPTTSKPHATRLAQQPPAVRHHRPRACSPSPWSRWEVLLSKGPGVGLVRRSLPAAFRRSPCSSSVCLVALVCARAPDRQSAHQLPHARATETSDACCIIIFCAFAVLYANTVSLPALLQSLFGYDATTSGLVLSPAGIFAVVTLFIVGMLLGARHRCPLPHGRGPVHRWRSATTGCRGSTSTSARGKWSGRASC